MKDLHLNVEISHKWPQKGGENQLHQVVSYWGTVNTYSSLCH